MRKLPSFTLGYFFGLFLFFLTPRQNLDLAKIEKMDLKLLKNEIVILKSNVYRTAYFETHQPSIFNVAQVAREEKIDIKTEKTKGGSSIFVEAFQIIRLYSNKPINYYDQIENQFVKKSVLLSAHWKCLGEINNLPREINKKDKTVKFNNNYSSLFEKDENYEKIFGYNLYVEENLAKNSPQNKINEGKKKLFKKYGKDSKTYLRENLFQNPCIIKSEGCKYSDIDNSVTIYYDEFTDLFAIVDSKKNSLVDLGIATKFKYAEIFAFKSSGVVKKEEICSKPRIIVDDSTIQNQESKEIQVYQEQTILSPDEALAILKAKYDSNFITVENGEFKIQDWQAAKKIEHAVCFGLNPEDFGFSQDQARQINAKGGIRFYVQQGKKLPSLDFIRAYQTAIKNFCEDPTRSVRNDESTFRDQPCITFFNQQTRQIIIFDRETKIFITAYKLAERSVDEYVRTGQIGSN